MEPIISLSTFGMLPPDAVIRHVAEQGFSRVEYPMEQHRGVRFAPEAWPDLWQGASRSQLPGLSLQGTLSAFTRLQVTCVGVSGHCEMAQCGAVKALKTRILAAKRLGAEYVSTGIGQGRQHRDKHDPKIES